MADDLFNFTDVTVKIDMDDTKKFVKDTLKDFFPEKLTSKVNSLEDEDDEGVNDDFNIEGHKRFLRNLKGSHVINFFNTDKGRNIFNTLSSSSGVEAERIKEDVFSILSEENEDEDYSALKVVGRTVNQMREAMGDDSAKEAFRNVLEDLEEGNAINDIFSSREEN